MILRSHINAFSGYGQHSRELGRAIERLGVPVLLQPASGIADEQFIALSPWQRTRLVREPPDEWVLQSLPPGDSFPTGRRGVAFSMWESTRLRVNWCAQLDRFAAVVVPCRWCARCFRNSGVTAPIHTVPLGVDAALYRPGDQRKGVFGAAGRIFHGGMRKGLQDAIDVFRAAFPTDPGVRLELKSWPDERELTGRGDQRVRIIREPWSDAEFAAWLRSLTAFMSLSRSEGFGLIPLQALASGVPVVATGYSGHAEYLDATVGYVLGHREVPAQGVYAGLGDWGCPDRRDAVSALRAIRADPAVAQAKGRVGRLRAKQFPWTRTATALLKILQSVGALNDQSVNDQSEQNRSSLFSSISARKPIGPIPTVHPTRPGTAVSRVSKADLSTRRRALGCGWRLGRTGCGTGYCLRDHRVVGIDLDCIPCDSRPALPRPVTLAAVLMVGRVDTLERGLASVAPFVDRIVALVDDRAPEAVDAILTAYQARFARWVWPDDFALALNRLAEQAGTDWVLQIDSDEVLTGGAELRRLIAQGETEGVDVWWVPVRHWADLEMHRESTQFPGDNWQYRLRRASVRFDRRVHPELRAVSAARQRQSRALVIEHFNMALRSASDWEKVDRYYARLGATSIVQE